MFKLPLIFVATYLIAAIPTGYWMGLAFGKDITKIGSGSTGATNVLRSVGKWQAVVVLIVDILKGFAPILIAKKYFHIEQEYSELVFLALVFLPMLAHSRSIYIGLKGGKASATGFGVLLAINWIVALITIAIWGATVFISGISSLGSIVAIPLVPVWLWLFGASRSEIGFGIAAFVFIVLIKHRTNIVRLIKGEEYSFKKPKD